MKMNSTERRKHNCGQRLRFLHADPAANCMTVWPPKDLNGRTLEEYCFALIELYRKRGIDQELVGAEIISAGGKVFRRWSRKNAVAA